MSLRLVHSRQVACWPWRLRENEGREVQFATCRTCERDIAQPSANARDVPVCLYCGIDSGLLVAVDIPLDEPFLYASQGLTSNGRGRV